MSAVTPEAKERQALLSIKLCATKYAVWRKISDSIKVAAGCIDCGYNAHPAALDFDHKDKTQKKFGLGHAAGRRWESVLEEMAKCEIRCANCHRIKTVLNGEHGKRKRKHA